jgi:hypothetical protein
MSNILDYAPAIPLFQRKLFRRGLLAAILLAFLVTTYFLTHRWIARQWHTFLLLRAQDQCLNYAPDPRQLLYSEDPASFSTLVAKGYQRATFSVGSPPALSYDFVAAPTPWRKLTQELSAAGIGGARGRYSSLSPIAYLHALKAPSGESFLACVERFSRTETELSFWAHTHTLLTRSAHPDEFLSHSGVANLPTAPTPPATDPLRFFPAIAAAPDGMSFTMEYEIAGVKGHIRGTYTQDPRTPPTPPTRLPNFPTLQMQILDGPLKP